MFPVIMMVQIKFFILSWFGAHGCKFSGRRISLVIAFLVLKLLVGKNVLNGQACA